MTEPASSTASGDVLVGGRERRPIVIVEHDVRWSERFAIERDRIRTALRDDAALIEHIGSTAVPGLAAKPIVDILVAVDDVGDPTITARLVAGGYRLRVRGPDHRMFRTPERDVHVHVWRSSDAEIARHLRFRDRLRADPTDRVSYEQLKRRLAEREWEDMNAYAQAKSALIAEILARAAAPGGS